jgi:hypothetical protein
VAVRLGRPPFGVHLRVVYRELGLKIPEILSPVAFDMEDLAVRAAVGKNPLVIIETRCIDYRQTSHHWFLHIICRADA